MIKLAYNINESTSDSKCGLSIFSRKQKKNNFNFYERKATSAGLSFFIIIKKKKDRPKKQACPFMKYYAGVE